MSTPGLRSALRAFHTATEESYVGADDEDVGVGDFMAAAGELLKEMEAAEKRFERKEWDKPPPQPKHGVGLYKSGGQHGGGQQGQQFAQHYQQQYQPGGYYGPSTANKKNQWAYTSARA